MTRFITYLSMVAVIAIAIMPAAYTLTALA